MARFQAKSKQFLLTIAQNGTPLEELRSALEVRMGPLLRFAVISSELHSDGSPHRHLYLQFQEVHRVNKSTHFDFLTQDIQHVNIQKVGKTFKDQVKACRYVMKDKEFVLLNITQAELDVELELKSSGTKDRPIAKIAAALSAGETVSSVSKSFPTETMMHLKKLMEFQNWIRSEQLKTKTLTFVRMQIKDVPEFCTRPQDRAKLEEICAWFNTNIYNRSRPIRSPQLWLWGPPSIGKSTLISHLEKCLKVYHVPAEDWDCGYEKGLDLAILDEFTGYKTLYWMNRFLDGSSMPLKKKGVASNFIKDDNIPVLVMSNSLPQDVYKEAASKGLPALDALAGANGRLLIIEVDTFIRDLEIITENSVQE